MPNKKNPDDKSADKKEKEDNAENNVSPENHVGKKVNKDRSKSKKDLDVKNEVTGANLDAPPA